MQRLYEKLLSRLKKQAIKIINHKKKEIAPLTNEEEYKHEQKKLIYVKDHSVLMIITKNTVR